jgi:hypothetical protein
MEFIDHHLNKSENTLVTRHLRWPVDGLHQQLCSHQPTACVVHSMGSNRRFDLMTTDEEVTKTNIPIMKTRRVSERANQQQEG